MKIKDLEFTPFISKGRIQKKVKELAQKINSDYVKKNPVLLPVLNGSFMFASDLMKHLTISSRLSFVKISSYSGTASTGNLKMLIGLEESLFNQEVVIIEDIIDTGLTLNRLLQELEDLGTKSVEVIALLRKQPAREKNISVKYIGFDINDEFVIGYGLDYDGLGRSFTDIYKMKA